jgi:hypothetical protein
LHLLQLGGCASDPWRNFSAKLSCPNRREFLRKFVEFAPRGAFQTRIPGDSSLFERNRASLFAETLLFDVASLICCAASDAFFPVCPDKEGKRYHKYENFSETRK